MGMCIDEEWTIIMMIFLEILFVADPPVVGPGATVVIHLPYLGLLL